MQTRSSDSYCTAFHQAQYQSGGRERCLMLRLRTCIQVTTILSCELNTFPNFPVLRGHGHEFSDRPRRLSHRCPGASAQGPSWPCQRQPCREKMAERASQGERREKSRSGAAVLPISPGNSAPRTPGGAAAQLRPRPAPPPQAGLSVPRPRSPGSPEGGPLPRSPALRARRTAAPFVEELLEQGGGHGSAAPLAAAQRAASGGGRGTIIPGAAAEPPSIPRRRGEARRGERSAGPPSRHLPEGRALPAGGGGTGQGRAGQGALPAHRDGNRDGPALPPRPPGAPHWLRAAHAPPPARGRARGRP